VANESLVKSRAPRGSYRKKSALYATADAPPLDMMVLVAGIVGPPQAGYIYS
jgi:hypothetical protein